jgi:hypothetical protein
MKTNEQNKMTRLEIFNKAIAEMPTRFTSHEFSAKVRSLGWNPKPSGELGDFLCRYARNDYQHSKNWTKFTAKNENLSLFNTNKITVPNITKSFQVTDEVDKIKTAIELLKSNGYKILKPKTDYEEI